MKKLGLGSVGQYIYISLLSFLYIFLYSRTIYSLSYVQQAHLSEINNIFLVPNEPYSNFPIFMKRITLKLIASGISHCFDL